MFVLTKISIKRMFCLGYFSANVLPTSEKYYVTFLLLMTNVSFNELLSFERPDIEFRVVCFHYKCLYLGRYIAL